jgi:hypothetical protein
LTQCRLRRLGLSSSPTSGLITLPRHLKWSGNPRYDLNQPGRIVNMYRAVINEAATPTDLHTYLDRSSLVRLWATMCLLAAVRQPWEGRFSELAGLRRGSAA